MIFQFKKLDAGDSGRMIGESEQQLVVFGAIEYLHHPVPPPAHQQRRPASRRLVEAASRHRRRQVSHYDVTHRLHGVDVKYAVKCLWCDK